MQNHLKQLSCLFLVGIVLFTSCKDPEPKFDPDNDPDAIETSITFHTIKDSAPLADVLVGITPNAGDRDNGIFIHSGTTNSSGEITFENLSDLTYYYNASYNNMGNPINRKSQITLEIGDEVDRDLNF